VGTQGQNTINIASTSAQLPTDQGVDNKKKGTVKDKSKKDVLANPADPKKKIKVCTNRNPK
jgi:hypothetical protein